MGKHLYKKNSTGNFSYIQEMANKFALQKTQSCYELERMGAQTKIKILEKKIKKKYIIIKI